MHYLKAAIAMTLGVGPIYQENSCKYLPFGKKIVKIGPVDTEIALLIVKKN